MPKMPVASPGGEAVSYFLVDPLDGTREFIAGRDEYTVNIALSDRMNMAIDLPYVDHNNDDANAVSRLKGHQPHRTRVVKWCRENMLKVPPVAPRPASKSS